MNRFDDAVQISFFILLGGLGAACAVYMGVIAAHYNGIETGLWVAGALMVWQCVAKIGRAHV